MTPGHDSMAVNFTTMVNEADRRNDPSDTARNRNDVDYTYND